jgi:hypothetical protein
VLWLAAKPQLLALRVYRELFELVDHAISTNSP